MLRTQALLRLGAALAGLLALLAGPARAGGRAARFLAQTAPAAEPNVTAFDRTGGGLLQGGTPWWLPQGQWSGDGTAYSEAVSNTGKGFACSYRFLNDWASRNFAAINKPMWDEGRACGRCITAWCVDERCATRNKPVQVQVVDQCPECKEGDVDFSIPAYRDITGMWPHRLAIQWEWSDCSAKLDGPIRMAPKDGINPQWQAFYFSNAKYPLKSIKLNGVPLQRNEFQFWIHSGQLSTPCTLEMEAVTGATLTLTTSDPYKDQPLGGNFA
ncbi:Expansin 1 [Chlorella sorokiniana]|uniref:Expansin 1 n=1 Tax=Chlorella sorokiniana TaxID=3076 RepID=A0A2P6TL19_CHLSO|nr:Expansin 1 [Chlorella sorokiniana]|eukprot:PRW44946.1 Expansin 1 [Chlorella sorokiniana]